MTTHSTDDYARLEDLAHQLTCVQPLAGQYLTAAVSLTRSGEVSPRQLAVAALTIATRLGDDHRAFADQLRGAVQRVRLTPAQLMDAPDYERDEPDYSRPIHFREGL